MHKITVIIPSYERQEYLGTCLRYWNNYPVSVIIVDGSREVYSKPRAVKATIDYFHMPASIEKRLRFASTLIKTEYAIICPDDEFHSFEALQHGAEILANQPSVSAVCGEVLGFATLGKDFLLKDQYQNHSLDISGSNALQRFSRRRSIEDSVIFYSLIRKDLMKLAARFISDETFVCPYVAEVQMEAILCAAGEVRIMPRVFWFRNRNSSAVSTDEYDRSLDLNSWLKDPKNSERITRLTELSSKYFLAVSNGDNSLSGENFLTAHMREDDFEMTLYQTKGNFNLRDALRKVYFYFPVTLKKVIRWIILSLFGRTDSGLFNVERYLKHLKEKKILYNHEEINRIRGLVLEFERLMKKID